MQRAIGARTSPERERRPPRGNASSTRPQAPPASGTGAALASALVAVPAFLAAPALAAALALAVVPSASAAQPAGGEECEEGPITHIFVDNHSIFDVDNLPEDRRIRWAYDAANAMHVRTREGVIRRELPVEAGDCPDADDFREAARILRELRFIARADIFAVPQPDGTRHLVVDTRDEWSTRFTFAIEGDDGLRIRGGSVEEENFLGRGALVGAFYDSHEEVRDLGGAIEVPRFLGTRLDLRLMGARTRGGRAMSQQVVVPFVGEEPARAFRQRVRFRDDLFNYAVDREDHDLSHVLLPVEVERVEVAAARRFGRPGRLSLLGFGLSRERVVPRVEPGSVEGVQGGDFGERSPLPEGELARFENQGGARGATRLNLLAGRRHIEYVERRGLDPVRGVQDVPVGREARVSLGPSLGVLSPSGVAAPRDVFGRLRLFAGSADGPWILQAHAALEGRRVLSGGVDGTGWRDLLADAEALIYRKDGFDARHTMVARVASSGGWSLTSPYQLTLGGPQGVRGLADDQIPSARRVVASVEDRITLPRGPLGELADFGLTLFADAGRAWAGDAPFARSSGWHASVGAGLRIGFPAETASVIRIDLAHPLGAEASGLRLRISSSDFLGIMSDPGSLQLNRSRRAGVGTDFVGVGR